MRGSLVILLLLGACAGSRAALPPADLAALHGQDRLSALLEVDRIEYHGWVGYAPVLYAVASDRTRNHELRTRCAAALCSFGLRWGGRFCVAVLGANLEAFAASDRAFGLPDSDRWAFARELALRALRARLLAAGETPPPYDPNMGARDLERATSAFREAIDRIAWPSTDQLGSAIPRSPPSGTTLDAWRSWRTELLAGQER